MDLDYTRDVVCNCHAVGEKYHEPPSQFPMEVLLGWLCLFLKSVRNERINGFLSPSCGSPILV